MTSSSEENQGFYRVEEQLRSEAECKCGNCVMWTVVYEEDGMPVEIGQAWQGEAGQAAADDVCDLMNMAYEAGRKKLEPVMKLASELCDAVDAQEEDVGGHRHVNAILSELGPAVEAAK